MQIALPIPLVTVTGPSVAVNLAGSGLAEVSITLKLGDEYFHFPKPNNELWTRDFPKGQYLCSTLIGALHQQSVGIGETYNASINIAGQAVAMTSGILPDTGHDSRIRLFQMVVQ